MSVDSGNNSIVFPVAVDFVCGGVSATVTNAMLTPWEHIIVKYNVDRIMAKQAGNKRIYSSFFGCAKTIFQEQGPRVFYYKFLEQRSTIPRLAIVLSAKNQLEYTFADYMHPHAGNILACGTAGIIAAGIMDLTHFSYLRSEGLVTILLAYPQAALFWGITVGFYDTLQPSLIGSGYNFPANFVLGTLTAGIASFVSAPLLHTRNIVARTYFTQEHTSQIGAIQNVYKKFGIRAFFKTPHFYTYCFGGSYLAIFGVLKEIFDF